MDGGFVPIEYSLGLPPVFALSVAGDLWSRAPVPEIYPGPLVPGILHSGVAEPDFDAVLGLILDLALPDLPVDEMELIRQPADGPTLADAPGVEVRFTDPAGAHSLFIEAYASSFHRDPRVDLVRDLIGRLGRAGGPAASEWTGDRLQVWVGPGTVHDEAVLVERPWPLPDPPHEEEYFDCQVVEGALAADLMDTFRAAHHGYRWVHEGMLYQVLARWLIPGEPGCEG